MRLAESASPGSACNRQVATTLASGAGEIDNSESRSKAGVGILWLVWVSMAVVSLSGALLCISARPTSKPIASSLSSVLSELPIPSTLDVQRDAAAARTIRQDAGDYENRLGATKDSRQDVVCVPSASINKSVNINTVERRVGPEQGMGKMSKKMIRRKGVTYLIGKLWP
jgi:hypothetical protein